MSLLSGVDFVGAVVACISRALGTLPQLLGSEVA